MAFYKLNVKVFSRGKGSCAIRSAAYRAGERIRNERTRIMANFASRKDVVHKEILLPAKFAGNAAMDWARDRTTLWNEVEKNKRLNARLAREVLVVLPAELHPALRVRLALRFGQELADRYLGAVDVTVHLPRALPDSLNHHAHLLMTTRQVGPEGMGPRTILDQTGTNLRAMGLGPSKNELLLIRERWAQITNEAFREVGLDMRIDHRSLAARGITREPRVGIPHTILCIERRTGVPSEWSAAIRAGYEERVAARLKGPDELARVLQKQREAAYQRRLERDALPKKNRDPAYVAEQRRKKRQLYEASEARKAQQRAYYQKTKPSQEERAIQRLLKWRQRQRPPETEEQAVQRLLEWRQRQRPPETEEQAVQRLLEWRRRQGPPETEEQAVQRLLKWRQQQQERPPAPTAEDSARNWLAHRERQKQAELTRGVAPKHTLARATGKAIEADNAMSNRQKKKERTRKYDYSL